MLLGAFIFAVVGGKSEARGRRTLLLRIPTLYIVVTCLSTLFYIPRRPRCFRFPNIIRPIRESNIRNITPLDIRMSLIQIHAYRPRFKGLMDHNIPMVMQLSLISFVFVGITSPF
jgi:hypothetical protein